MSFGDHNQDIVEFTIPRNELKTLCNAVNRYSKELQTRLLDPELTKLNPQGANRYRQELSQTKQMLNVFRDHL